MSGSTDEDKGHDVKIPHVTIAITMEKSAKAVLVFLACAISCCHVSRGLILNATFLSDGEVTKYQNLSHLYVGELDRNITLPTNALVTITKMESFFTDESERKSDRVKSIYANTITTASKGAFD